MGWPKEHIPDQDRLFRRIPPWHYIPEEDRMSSAAFGERKNEFSISVNWEKYITPEKAVRKYPTFHLAALVAKIPRQVGQEVKHTPSRLVRSYSSIIGKKTKLVRRFLARNSVFLIKR